MHIYSFNDLNFTLKHLKRSYMFRSYDHPQGAYTELRWVGAVAPTQRNDENHWVFLNYKFSKEQYMLPEDDCMIETCRNVLSVLMWILDHSVNICAFVGALVK